jgi:hypothetical protein
MAESAIASQEVVHFYHSYPSTHIVIHRRYVSGLRKINYVSHSGLREHIFTRVDEAGQKLGVSQ